MAVSNLVSLHEEDEDNEEEEEEIKPKANRRKQQRKGQSQPLNRKKNGKRKLRLAPLQSTRKRDLRLAPKHLRLNSKQLSFAHIQRGYGNREKRAIIPLLMEGSKKQ
jgi:ATPase subunit of ABC transporter with duplicated ATPase domains